MRLYSRYASGLLALSLLVFTSGVARAQDETRTLKTRGYAAFNIEANYLKLREAGIPIPKEVYSFGGINLTLPAGTTPFREGALNVTPRTLVLARGIVQSMVTNDINVNRPLQFEVTPKGEVLVLLSEEAVMEKTSVIDEGLKSAADFQDAVERTLRARGQTDLTAPGSSQVVNGVEGILGRKLTTAQRAKLDQQTMKGEKPLFSLAQIGVSYGSLQARFITETLRGDGPWSPIFLRVQDALKGLTPEHDATARQLLSKGLYSGAQLSTETFGRISEIRDAVALAFGAVNENSVLSRMVALIPQKPVQVAKVEKPESKAKGADLLHQVTEALERFASVFDVTSVNLTATGTARDGERVQGILNVLIGQRINEATAEAKGLEAERGK